MAKEAEFTDQIVVMNTAEQGNEIRVLAELFGVSVAEVSRVAQGYGLDHITAHYTKAGRHAKMSRDQAQERVKQRRAGGAILGPVVVAEVEQVLRPKRGSAKSKIPAAAFSSAAR